MFLGPILPFPSPQNLSYGIHLFSLMYEQVQVFYMSCSKLL